MEAHPGDSDAANVFLARARAQLETDAMMEKNKAAAPLPTGAAKDGNGIRRASEDAIRTALPHRRRPRVVTRKLPQVFPHMDYPEDKRRNNMNTTHVMTGRGKGTEIETIEREKGKVDSEQQEEEHRGKDKTETPKKSCFCC